MSTISKLDLLERRRKRLQYELNDVVREISDVTVRGTRGMAREVRSFATDLDVVVLLLWSLFSPAAALAYIVWRRYPTLRLFTVPPLLLVSVVHFIVQWGSVALFVYQNVKRIL